MNISTQQGLILVIFYRLFNYSNRRFSVGSQISIFWRHHGGQCDTILQNPAEKLYCDVSVKQFSNLKKTERSDQLVTLGSANTCGTLA